MAGQQPETGPARRAFKRLSERAYGLLEGWVLGLSTTLLSSALGAIAKWGDGLSDIQRGMLWGASATFAILTAVVFVCGLTIYARRRGTIGEVTELVSKARGIAGEAERVYGPQRDIRHTTQDFLNTVQGLHASLVGAARFEKRGALFKVLKDLERTHSETEPAEMWAALHPHLDLLGKWADYADEQLLLRRPPSKDPLGS